jgi:hypothetical protein
MLQDSCGQFKCKVERIPHKNTRPLVDADAADVLNRGQLTPCTILRCVDADRCELLGLVRSHKDDEEGAAAAVEVVAAGRGMGSTRTSPVTGHHAPRLSSLGATDNGLTRTRPWLCLATWSGSTRLRR